MSDEKPVLEYQYYDPTLDEVVAMAVNVQTSPHSVSATYTIQDIKDRFHERVPSHFELMTLNEASRLYRLQKVDNLIDKYRKDKPESPKPK